MRNTSEQFDAIAVQCADIFSKKARDYGTAWRILRPSSLTDQIFIKAHRIRSIELKGEAKINEGIVPEFIGIVNYSIMALIQLEKGFEDSEQLTLPLEEIEKLFHQYMANAKSLMMDKNHDYGEAWRQMRISSLNDIILMKLLRIKQIEDNNGQTTVSEGLDANYYDIINYAIFALIRFGVGS
ncbi:MAG: DUF1599 domain-containing protein [Bacteroidales bacterium]|jgi:hypothetical protein|nr:DUF1599 domain-containing protein [Bacteroidales bacterium]